MVCYPELHQVMKVGDWFCGYNHPTEVEGYRFHTRYFRANAFWPKVYGKPQARLLCSISYNLDPLTAIWLAAKSPVGDYEILCYSLIMFLAHLVYNVF